MNKRNSRKNAQKSRIFDTGNYSSLQEIEFPEAAACVSNSGSWQHRKKKHKAPTLAGALLTEVCSKGEARAFRLNLTEMRSGGLCHSTKLSRDQGEGVCAISLVEIREGDCAVLPSLVEIKWRGTVP